MLLMINHNYGNIEKFLNRTSSITFLPSFLPSNWIPTTRRSEPRTCELIICHKHPIRLLRWWKKNIPPKIRIIHVPKICLFEVIICCTRQKRKKKREKGGGGGVSSASESRPSGVLKWSKKDGFGACQWVNTIIPCIGWKWIGFQKRTLIAKRQKQECMLGWMDGWLGWMDKWGQCSQEPWVVYSITEKWFCLL